VNTTKPDKIKFTPPKLSTKRLRRQRQATQNATEEQGEMSEKQRVVSGIQRLVKRLRGGDCTEYELGLAYELIGWAYCTGLLR
jgi:hypothetical protein